MLVSFDSHLQDEIALPCTKYVDANAFRNCVVDRMNSLIAATVLSQLILGCFSGMRLFGTNPSLPWQVV